MQCRTIRNHLKSLNQPFVFNLLLVPTDSPKIIEMVNTSSTSLLVRWDHWRAYFLPGVTEGYAIKKTYLSSTAKTVVNGVIHEKNLTGLNKYKEYCVTVQAIIRREGPGDDSEEMCASTAEDGKNSPGGSGIPPLEFLPLAH